MDVDDDFGGDGVEWSGVEVVHGDGGFDDIDEWIIVYNFFYETSQVEILFNK